MQNQIKVYEMWRDLWRFYGDLEKKVCCPTVEHGCTMVMMRELLKCIHANV